MQFGRKNNQGIFKDQASKEKEKENDLKLVLRNP